jgi:cell pole-organizing protein PopZ
MAESEKANSAKMMLAEIRELMDAAETGSEWKTGLARQRRDQPNPTEPATERDRVLEEIVCELLRPMLQKWLDQNMRSIVEKEIKVALREPSVGR